MMTQKPRQRGKRRGVLGVIAALLVTSAALRLLDGTGAALAEAAAEAGATHTANPEPASDATCLGPEETAAVLAALSEREARVAEKEAQIIDRMQALRVAETAIDQKLAELATAEQSLSGTIAIASTAAESDLGNLTAVYENMKPRDAAALFEQMPPDFAAGFLGRMRPEAAALIFAGLAPDKAYAISVSLAGRNALAPTE